MASKKRGGVVAKRLPTNLKVMADTPELDAMLRRIREYESTIGEAAWYIGKELNAIHHGRLWVRRMTPEGVQAYASFEGFILAECKVTKQWARVMMGVARGYKSPEIVSALGTAKAYALLRLPPKYRESLMHRVISEGISKRTVYEMVRQVRVRIGDTSIRNAMDKSWETRLAASKARNRANTSNEAELIETVRKILVAAKNGRLDLVQKLATDVIGSLDKKRVVVAMPASRKKAA